MKKLISLLLVLSLVFSLCACGGSGSASTSTSKSADDSVSNAALSTDVDENENTASAGTYLTYEDLPRTEKFFVRPEDSDAIILEMDYPNIRFKTASIGMGSENSLDYAIVVAHSERPMPDTSLEDAFYALLNGERGYHTVLKSVNRATYSDLEPEMETLTLDCGKEAIKFTGIQHLDDYGTLSDCPVLGYATLIGDTPVITGYILYEEENVDADTIAELEHYALEMINTVRFSEEN